jgi:hypothetical protein
MARTNPMGDRLNPDLIKAAAGMAEPGREWRLHEYDNGVVGVITGPFSNHREFDPKYNDLDAHALMLALMKEGWEFGQNYLSKQYVADKMTYESEEGFKAAKIANESFPLLLLKVVSSHTGIKMYV